MNIVYVNQDFPPEVGAGPARVVEMSREWQDLGAHVTIATGMPNRRIPGREDGRIPEPYRGRLFMEQELEGMRVLRAWLYASPKRSFARTVANNMSFALTSSVQAMTRVRKPDVIIASSPPFLTHLTGELLRLVKRVPLVLEVRDLWPDYLVDMGVIKSRLLQRAVFGLERYLLSKAARVVVVTGSFRHRMIQKGVAADRIEVISNGVDTERYRPDPTAMAPIPEMASDGDRFNVGYLGNFGAGQELRTVLDAAAVVRAEAPDIHFVLVGDGKQKPEVEARANELQLSNLSIHPPILKEETRAFYSQCDICLVPLAPVPIFSETVPSKLFEVMACGRPVLASVSGEAAEIVGSSGAGVISPPGDAEAMARAIIRLRSASPAERQEYGEAGRRFVQEHYDRKSLAHRYYRLLQDVGGSGYASSSG